MQLTVLALLQFLAKGHTLTHGVFRAHARRLVEFLEKPRIHAEVVEEDSRLGQGRRFAAGELGKLPSRSEAMGGIESALKKLP